ncbi:MAG: methionyl-tRNA formyltransferase [Spirochaetes bacterium RIFOXYC1_FULL_54_7]|nr:MAG: methionyl-tRNA formyltransferase [Spirochaetes bacterium RIFOXYC1_FULL_54_7]
MRILFTGSPEIAVPSLLAVGRDFDLVGVLTNPPAPKGRGLSPAPTPVAQAAAEHFPGVPILAPERLGPAEREAVTALQPELLVVFAYGRIFGPRFLGLFPQGGVNVHPSLLPRWRGPSPIPYAILARDAETGLCVQRLALRLDSGDVLGRQRLPLGGRETAGVLSDWAARAGADLLVAVISLIADGSVSAEPQDEAQATWSRQMSKDDGLVDWSRSALEIDAMVRAYTPWPGAWTTLGGERLGLLETWPYPAETGNADPGMVAGIDKSRGIMVQTGAGLLALRVLQARGKKPLAYRDFANGARNLPGARLGGTGYSPVTPATGR